MWQCKAKTGNHACYYRRCHVTEDSRVWESGTLFDKVCIPMSTLCNYMLENIATKTTLIMGL